MPTLMRWKNGDGTQARCDSRCHNARLPECDCRCGGLFHGAGRNGTLSERLAGTDCRTLAEMAKTPSPRRLTLTKHQKKLPRTQKPAQTLWQQVTPGRWITTYLKDPAGGIRGEIERRENDSYVLTVIGAEQPETTHPSLIDAMGHYTDLRRLAVGSSAESK